MARVLVLLAALLFAAYLLNEGLRRLRGRLGELLSTQPSPPARRAGGSRAAEALVACAGCGVHVLRSRALATARLGGDEARFYCSESCRLRAAASA